jgi:hypothetical protein
MAESDQSTTKGKMRNTAMTKKTDPASDLRSRIVDIDAKRLMLMGERDQLSYDAIVGRNSAAAKRVAEIGTELGRLADETAVLNAALTEAGRRDAAAAAEKRDVEERGNAEKALALLDEFAKDGAELEEAVPASSSSTSRRTCGGLSLASSNLGQIMSGHARRHG